MATSSSRSWLEQLKNSNVRIIQLVSMWLSGMLAGEIIVFVVLVNYREVKPVTTPTDWSIALVLAAIALVIPAIIIFDEIRGE